MTEAFTTYDPSRLPATVVAYLDAHDAKRTLDAKASFAPDATVIDDGNTYHGIEEIAAWIDRSGSEYEFTQTRIGQSNADTDRPIVQVRLDGNFPGGTVTLRYQFIIESGQIKHLAIAV